MKIVSWKEVCADSPSLAVMAREAIRIRRNAYATASGFKVGAVVAVGQHPGVPSDTRLWFPGCNAENAMYEATHAEQAAIARMIAELGARPKPKIAAVVVACIAGGKNQHALPCGFCRQWLLEFGTPETRVYGVRLVGKREKISGVECTTLGELLPYAFKL